MSRFVRRTSAASVAVPSQRRARGELPHVARALALQRGAGNAAFGRMLMRTKHTIVQHGEMSGDMFQIAAALINDPDLHIFLVTATVPGPRDKAPQIRDFYVNSSGIAPERIHLETHDDPVKRVKQILSTTKDAKWGHQASSVGDATNRLKSGFKKDQELTKTVREQWLSTSGMTQKELDKLVRDWKIPLENPLAVLWSRQSGALGGLHPDLDSSYTAIGQLAEEFDAQGYTVIIAGDDPKGKITAPQPRPAYAKAVRMGEFWKKSLAGKPRTAQFAFFEHLRQLVPTLTHVGMRSGNLEAYAYMGHRVMFIEERDRGDAVRMQKLVGLDHKLKYRTVKIEQLPTRTGHALMGPPANRVLEGGKTESVDTSKDPRYATQRRFDAELSKLKKWKKVVDDAAVPNAAGAKTRAKQSQDARLTQAEQVLLTNYTQWVPTRDAAPPHQRELLEYQWLKANVPGLAEPATGKGLGPGVAKDIVEQAKTTLFWCVSVPAPDLPAFLVATGEPVEETVYLGTDGEEYVLWERREERERISESGAARTQVSVVYDLVRRPSGASA